MGGVVRRYIDSLILLTVWRVNYVGAKFREKRKLPSELNFLV